MPRHSELGAPLADGVRDLIVEAYLPDHVRFFAVLAGTEFIEEELGALLVKAPKFVDLFDRKRWAWGEVHLFPHDEGPSHLEIDLDLARAYASKGLRPRTNLCAGSGRRQTFRQGGQRRRSDASAAAKSPLNRSRRDPVAAANFVERGRDMLGMRRGMLDLPQPGLTVGGIMNDQILTGIFAADFLRVAPRVRPGTNLDRHGVGGGIIANRRLVHHG